MINEPFNIISDNSISLSERIEKMSVYLGNKGYGDLNQEIRFISDFFKFIFSKYDLIHSFQWSQYQDYSDQGHHFDFESIKINEIFDIDFSGFEDAPNYKFNPNLDLSYSFYTKELNSSIYFEKIGSDRYRELFEELQTDNIKLKAIINYILIFFKSIYEHHRPYYFIYLFGRRAKVKISRMGIEINNDEIDYSDGKESDFHFQI